MRRNRGVDDRYCREWVGIDEVFEAGVLLYCGLKYRVIPDKGHELLMSLCLNTRM